MIELRLKRFTSALVRESLEYAVACQISQHFEIQFRSLLIQIIKLFKLKNKVPPLGQNAKWTNAKIMEKNKFKSNQIRSSRRFRSFICSNMIKTCGHLGQSTFFVPRLFRTVHTLGGTSARGLNTIIELLINCSFMTKNSHFIALIKYPT